MSHFVSKPFCAFCVLPFFSQQVYDKDTDRGTPTSPDDNKNATVCKNPPTKARDTMDKKTKETLLKAAEFSEQKQRQTTKRFNHLFRIGAMCYLLFALTKYSDICSPLPESIRGFIEGFFIGSALGSLLFGCVLSSEYGVKICEYKKRLLKK